MFQIFDHKTSATHGELILGLADQLPKKLKAFALMKQHLGMTTQEDAPLFVSSNGSDLSNSRLAGAVRSELLKAGAEFSATPNRFRHTVLTLVEYNALFVN